MEKKQYDIPEIDVLLVESDVITQPSYGEGYNETEEHDLVRISI